MAFVWQYTERAVNDLKLIQRKTAIRIVQKIKHYCSADDPFAFAKPLHGPLQGLFRFRIGEYRVIFRKESSGRVNILLILRIKNRKDAYD